jgi:hypothetical protein
MRSDPWETRTGWPAPGYACSAIAAGSAERDRGRESWAQPRHRARHGHGVASGHRERQQKLDELDLDLGRDGGAGDRDRTGMTSLEGWGSTIELRPRDGSHRRLQHTGPPGDTASRLKAPSRQAASRQQSSGRPRFCACGPGWHTAAGGRRPSQERVGFGWSRRDVAQLG